MRRIAIIGGGPMGLEAALYGACAGFEVRLYERGRIAENVRTWGHIRLFTEWGRNRSPLAERLLRERGVDLPPPTTTSTGDELAEYVLRLAALPPLKGRLRPQTEVLAITREHCLKSDFIADQRRANFPFRLLLRGSRGETVEPAAVVLDASGVYATPNWLGSGGAPCPGETALRHRLIYHLPDVAGRDRALFANRHSLVVGSGHSAASTLLAIAALMHDYPATRLTWVVRRDVPDHGYPYTLIPDDPSPHRNELHRRANELTGHEQVAFHPRTVVEALQYDGSRFHVALSSWQPGADGEVNLRDAVECDNVVAHTGYGPDARLWAELQVRTHPATGGPYRLAEALVASNRERGVGLSTGYAERQPGVPVVPREDIVPEGAPVPAPPPAVDRWRYIINDPELLRHPEPDFYVIGIKSYGRDAGFLMHNGFRQVRDAYRLISGDPALDLYAGALDA